MVFVIAGLVTSVKALCGLVSALFQYFMLVYFGWTAAEAMHLFDGLVFVFTQKRKYYVLKASLIVWCKEMFHSTTLSEASWGQGGGGLSPPPKLEVVTKNRLNVSASDYIYTYLHYWKLTCLIVYTETNKCIRK